MTRSTNAVKQSDLVLPLDDSAAELATVGGKGASLARLVRAGLPVPPGFHVSTAAYRMFVERDELRARILAAGSAEEIQRMVIAQPIPPAISAAVRASYAELGDVPVAVRSSATAEDLPDMSFAGQQDTYLNIRGADAVLDAVRRCWASLWTARAIEYRAHNKVDDALVEIAVVVQELVDAESAGVLFTANPTSGARDELVINASWGLGESVVSGQVTPDTIVVRRGTHEIRGESVNAKTVMTVRTDNGTAGSNTEQQATPKEKRNAPALERSVVPALAALGERIAELYQRPMDIEWARRDGQFFILQARPITTLHEVWNDSLNGKYLWTNGNLGEAIPDVMTPCTWSLVRIFMGHAMASSSLPDYRAYGNIGGRFYMNLSLAASLSSAFGISQKRFIKLTKDVFGRLPEGVDIPLLGLSRLAIIRRLTPVAIAVLRRARENKKKISAFTETAAGRCTDARARISHVGTATELVTLWRKDIGPMFDEYCMMLEAATRDGGGSALVTVRSKMDTLIGEKDATTLFTGLQSADDNLASLGPLIGLYKLAKDEITEQEFATTYGHRGPHEFEVSIARPAEDPEWITAELARVRSTTADVPEMLAGQRTAADAAWRKLAKNHPKQVPGIRARMRRWSAVARNREMARSEVIRMFWVLRAFVLRAAEITATGDDLFFLEISEIQQFLGGDTTQLDKVAARRSTYDLYRSLPNYPALIRGAFDPRSWAADPRRRTDFFDEDGGERPIGDAVTGFPGASGVVEGIARIISDPADADELGNGEILVTTVTNIGWTPLFPRAAAVVTDVGAPLSHAAIVARELGIPAVVGCGNATMKLRSGDRIRVDGERGIVDVLESTG